MWPSLGLVDAMRVSDDVERHSHRFEQIAKETFSVAGSTVNCGKLTQTARRLLLLLIKRHHVKITSFTVPYYWRLAACFCLATLSRKSRHLRVKRWRS